jgi:2-succinyl-6-hydroxy-2,4-cyclohexadiene-1-carboxylate synthase
LESRNPSSDLYVEIHPGNGPYLLLVHGILSSRAQWMLNLEALAKIARPVVVELWGHGRSPAPENPDPYRPEGYVEAFEQIRRRLGISEWLLCGQSLGAALTLKYTLDHPQRIIAQAITNTTSGLREIKNKDEAVKGAAFIGQRVLEEGAEGLKKIPVHPINARSLPEEVKKVLVEDSADLSVLGVANAIRYTTSDLSLRDQIYRNQVPTLLVCGKREKRFQPLRDFAAAHMPLLDIVDLDAGHAVNIDAAEEFNQAVSAFFLKYTPDKNLRHS